MDENEWLAGWIGDPVLARNARRHGLPALASGGGRVDSNCIWL